MPFELSENAIFLTGLSGSGKSAVGKALSRRLGIKLIDTDTLLARSEHMSIRKLFEQRGERYFRLRERETVLKLCADLRNTHRKAIVSLGGGSLINHALANRVKKSGVLIYLQVACADAAGRLLKSDTRPLILDEAGNKLSRTRLTQRLRELLSYRRPGFVRAHYRVPVTGRSAREVCGLILELLR